MVVVVVEGRSVVTVVTSTSAVVLCSVCSTMTLGVLADSSTSSMPLAYGRLKGLGAKLYLRVEVVTGFLVVVVVVVVVVSVS